MDFLLGEIPSLNLQGMDFMLGEIPSLLLQGMDFILLEIPSFVSPFLMMEFLLLDGISVSKGNGANCA